MRLIAVITLSLMAVTPASAQHALRPMGAVHSMDGCNVNSGYPDCHPERTYMGPTLPGSPRGVGLRLGAVHYYRSGTQNAH